MQNEYTLPDSGDKLQMVQPRPILSNPQICSAIIDHTNEYSRSIVAFIVLQQLAVG